LKPIYDIIIVSVNGLPLLNVRRLYK